MREFVQSNWLPIIRERPDMPECPWFMVPPFWYRRGCAVISQPTFARLIRVWLFGLPKVEA